MVNNQTASSGDGHDSPASDSTRAAEAAADTSSPIQLPNTVKADTERETDRTPATTRAPAAPTTIAITAKAEVPAAQTSLFDVLDKNKEADTSVVTFHLSKPEDALAVSAAAVAKLKEAATAPVTDTAAKQRELSVVVQQTDKPQTQTLAPAQPQLTPHAHAKILGMTRRWVILATCCTGALLASLQSNALIIAFAVLLENLDCTLDTLLWVVIAFQLVVTAVVVGIGKLGDAIGRARFFKMGFALFVLSALLAGFSKSENHGYDLVGYRVLMGIGAAIVFTNSLAICAEEFIPFGQMGVAQGVFQLAFALGAVLGPVVGGVLADADWRWVFWVNTIPGGIAVYVAVAYIHDKPHVPGQPTAWQKLQKIDVLGLMLNVAYVCLAMVLLTQTVLPTAGLDTTAGLTATAIATAIAFGLFVWRMQTAEHPLVPRDLFTNPLFCVSLLSQSLVSFTRNSVTFMLIFFFQGPYGQNPLQAGILMIPLGVGILLTALLAGRIADKVGVHGPWIVGSLAVFAGTLAMGFLHAHTNYWIIAAEMFVLGMGVGVFNAPSGAVMMASVQPAARGSAASFNMIAGLGPAMLAIVMVFKLVLTSLPYDQLIALFILGTPVSDSALNSFMSAISDVAFIGAACAIVAAPLGFFVPRGFKINAKPAAPAAAAPAQAQAVEITTTASASAAAPTQTQSQTQTQAQTEAAAGAPAVKPHLTIVVEARN